MDLLASIATLERDEKDNVTPEEFDAKLQNLKADFYLKNLEDKKELKRYKAYVEGKLQTVKHVPIVLISNVPKRIDVAKAKIFQQ